MVYRIGIHNKSSSLFLDLQPFHLSPNKFPHLAMISWSFRSIAPYCQSQSEQRSAYVQEEIPGHIRRY
jgi:hypothetical protein